MLSDEEVRSRYGADVAISRKGSYVLVHLDHPTREMIHARTDKFDPDDYFDDDCLLCTMQKSEGAIIYATSCSRMMRTSYWNSSVIGVPCQGTLGT